MPPEATQSKNLIHPTAHRLKRRHPDIPIPYVLLLYIPLLVIPTPDMSKIKIEVSNMFGVFMLIIPIPDIYTGF